jgi:2-isopropylmalate synthase
MGYALGPEQIQTVFEAFKLLADKKKEIYDADIAALIEQEMRAVPELWSLVSYEVASGTGKVPRATLRLRRGGEELSTELACGDGPVDAVFLAIEKLAGISVVCKSFNVHSVTVGKDAQGEVMVQVEHEGRLYRGRGISTDSLEASAKAFLDAMNRIAAANQAVRVKK